MTDQGSSENPLAIGGHFVLDGDGYTTDSYISLRQIKAVRHVDGQAVPIDILRIVQSALERSRQDDGAVEASGTEALSPEDLEVANERHEKLTVLIEAVQPTRELAGKIAAELGVSIPTIYRWRLAYLKSGMKIASLAPHHPSGGRGQPRIDPSADAIADETINELYLSNIKPTVSKVQEQVKLRCHRAGVKPPHKSTLRRRIEALDRREKEIAREGPNAAKKYKAVPGRFPGADYPNAVWQIDHTPADLCIVDEIYRRNIGRCWLTVAIDVYSRCVVGFYLSLDKPNATSVGMCLVNGILMKDGWLKAHGIGARWDVWGKPRTVLADNDKTFRCETVTQSAREHGINLEWRPVREPRWGGHIERLLGTINKEVQTLPGTTFSNPLVRGDYKPHVEAELTLPEFERYLAEWICGVYHVAFHEGIRRTPISKYEIGLLGDGVIPGTGFPEHEKDPARLLLDFLPFKRATVQADGITVNNITYYDPLIDPWIHAVDPKTEKKRKFVCRQDPRDISVLWFLDPEKNCYFRIPYRNPEHPSMTLWEYREVRAQLRAEGVSTVNETLIFETYERLERIRRDASNATQAARKADEKKKNNKRKARIERAQVDAAAAKANIDPAPTSVAGVDRSVPACAQWDDDEDVPRFRETAS